MMKYVTSIEMITYHIFPLIKRKSLFAGKNGLFYIVQVICKILDPKTSEYTASFVGRLVSVVISKVGSQLGENLDLILRAVLSKMQQAETLSVMQVSLGVV